MAADLAADPANGVHRPVLRRCPPLELRSLRLAGATARLRHQRLRRDAARAVGVGRQAACGEHADLRAQQRLHGRGAGAGRPRDRRRLPHAGWREFAGMRNLEVWYTRFEIEKLMPQLRSQVGGKMRKRLDKAVAKAFRRDNVQAFSKLSRTVDGERRIVSDPPLIVRLDDFPDSEERDRLKADGERLLLEYSLTLPHERRILLNQFRLVDSGTQGGRRRQRRDGRLGRAAARPGHARPAVPADQGGTARRCWRSSSARASSRTAGERVVAGQRIMQASSDIFLGWLHIPESVFGQERDYYVRQLRDWKGSIAVEAMDPRALSVYGQLCSATLAHAHARSGDRIAIASYLGRRRRLRPGRARLQRGLRRAERPRLRRARAARSRRGRVARRPRALMRLRTSLFDRGDNLAGGIYGTILVTSVVAAADSSRRDLALARDRRGDGARVLAGARLRARAGVAPRQQRSVLARESLRPDRAARSGRSCRRRSFPRSRSSPVGSASSRAQAAYWIAIGYGVVALIWWGLLIARKERTVRRSRRRAVVPSTPRSGSASCC